MDKPRVFISHSARGDENALAVLEELKAALADDFAVRVDMDHLELGDDWRNSINVWLGRCDAAIILLSNKALQRHYVAYEASVLTFRRNMAGPENFTVIPVFLDDVDYPKLQASELFAPTNIHEIQGAVAETDRARIVSRVREKLEQVREGLRPADDQATYLAALLAPLGPVANRCLSILGSAPDPWGKNDEPSQALAIKLMEVGLNRAWPAIQVFYGQLEKTTRLQVFDLIATSWVDLRSARYVSQVATGDRAERALALNAEQSLIAELYVLRASGLLPGYSWPLAPCGEGFLGEDVLGELKQKVGEDLRAALRMDPDCSPEELMEELDALETALRQPVFVVLPAAGVTRAVLDGLRAAFPTVTFFFLAGADQNTHALLAEVNVKFITPPLYQNFEGHFCSLYKIQRRQLSR